MTAGRRALVVLVLATLFLATLTTTQAGGGAPADDACPTPKYAVESSGQRVSTDNKKIKLKFSITNTFNATLDNYVIRMGINTDKVTYESYNVVGHTAKKKATTLFTKEPDGSLLAWTLYSMPAGHTFRFLVFVQVRDCASLGPVSFPISSYLDVDGVPLCPLEGPAATLRIVRSKTAKQEGRPRPTGCPTPAPTPAPTPSPTPFPTPFPSAPM